MRLKSVLPGWGIVSAAPGSMNTSNDVIDPVVEIESPVEPMAGTCQDILVGEKRWTGTLIPESVMDGQPIDYAKVRFKIHLKDFISRVPSSYFRFSSANTSLSSASELRVNPILKSYKSAFIRLTKVCLGWTLRNGARIMLCPLKHVKVLIVKGAWSVYTAKTKNKK